MEKSVDIEITSLNLQPPSQHSGRAEHSLCGVVFEKCTVNTILIFTSDGSHTTTQAVGGAEEVCLSTTVRWL